MNSQALESKSCAVKGCEDDYFCKGYCRKHYRRADYTGGDPIPAREQPRALCRVGGCGTEVFAKNLCQMHYGRQTRTGDVGPVGRVRKSVREKCSVDDCDDTEIAKGYCPRHYARFKRHGDASFVTTRSLPDAHDRECKWCGETFVAKDRRVRTCSTECAVIVEKIVKHVRKYGIEFDDYRRMWFEQNGLCKVCGQESRVIREDMLSIDHDHKCCDAATSCGKCVRGLVCSHCNRGMGFLDDDPVRLRAAAEYIESYV